LRRSSSNPENLQPNDFIMMQLDPFTANMRLYSPN
jgi:hypothetical protein